MSKNWHFNPGDHNAICDSCGRKFKASDLRKRWDGLYVCSEDWEPRHSLDFVRSYPDKITVPWNRPQLPIVFVPINWTQYPNEPIVITESIAVTADFYRYIGQITYPDDLDVVNGSEINLLAINTSSIDAPPPTNPEMFGLSESITSSIGFNLSLADSFTLSEVITEGEGEYPSDSVSFTESVVAFTITNKLLNAHTFNEVTIG
jgi:hypothetical protein